MPDSWMPPSGPPNGVPLHPADAKREIEEATVAARTHDHALRSQIAALSASRVVAGARLVTGAAEVDEASALAKRALVQSNTSARSGQRADAAKWTGAAQVFAKRLRDARVAVADAEAELDASGAQRARLETALSENVGRLQAVAAARLPVISGRKAARTQALVDETVAAISVPVGDIEARAAADAHAVLLAAGQDDDPLDGLEVTDDDLESEVDFGGTDEILDELRTELGLPSDGPSTPAASESASGDADADAGEPARSGDEAGDTEGPRVGAGAPPVHHASGARS